MNAPTDPRDPQFCGTLPLERNWAVIAWVVGGWVVLAIAGPLALHLGGAGAFLATAAGYLAVMVRAARRHAPRPGLRSAPDETENGQR